MPDFLSLCKEGIRISLYVQPKASKNEILGIHGDALKIRIQAPPVEGAANEACLKFIARKVKRPPSALRLVAGQTSRQKQVLVIPPDGCTPEVFCNQVRQCLQKNKKD